MPCKPPQHFSREPLNYDTLKRKCAEFHRRKAHPPPLVADYVVANRRLQQMNKAADPSYRYGAMAQVLDIPLNVPSAQLERELSRFVRRYHQQAVGSDMVVNAYVSSAHNVDISHAFELVQQNFHHKLRQRMPSTRSRMGPVATLIRVLLQKHDFHGCLKLVDSTINSEASVRARKRAALAWAGGAAAAAGSFAAMGSLHQLMGALGPLAQVSSVLLASCTAGVSAAAACLAVLQAASFDRVSWRPHTSFLHRWLHRQELVVMNQLVTFFEENHEVNVKNFHISGVRTRANLDTFDSNDYELLMPGQLMTSEGHTNVDAVARFFREELHKRRMMLNPLKEEAMFLSFWVNHGENFEWVEPDQDPAEMALMKTRQEE